MRRTNRIPKNSLLPRLLSCLLEGAAGAEGAHVPPGVDVQVLQLTLRPLHLDLIHRAARAVELIEVEYEELPAILDPRDAMKPGAVIDLLIGQPRPV